MSESINLELRKFTKEESQDERDALAREIREKRKDYFERKGSIDQDIQDLREVSTSEEVKAEEKREKVKMIEEEIAQNKSSKISELINFFEIRRLKRGLKTEKNTLESIEVDYLKVRQLLESLDSSLNDKHELDEAREVLTKFYEGKNEEWNKYVEYLKNTDLANVAEKYDVSFIHAIHPNFIPEGNSPLQKNVDWKTKLKIVMAFGPSISTSTIQEGDDWRKMWARMGLILNGGRIESALASDAGTAPIGLKARVGHGTYSDSKGIEDNIERAITYKNRNYNEFVVDDPQISGFYICLDDTDVIRNDLVSVSEIAEALSEYKIPIYAIKQGVIFEAEYDDQTRTLKVKNEISTVELLKIKFEIDDFKRTKIKEELFADSPFKISNAEMSKVDSRAQGRQTYIEINFWHGTKNLDDNPLLAEFPRIGMGIKYSVESGKLTINEVNTRTEEKRYREEEVRRSGLDNGFINIGFNTMHLGRSIENNVIYLDEMGKKLEEWKQRDIENQQENTNNEVSIKFTRDILNRIVFHIYGFAEQAGELGDVDTQTKAIELASQYLPYEEFKKVIESRIDSNGRLKITEADLESFL